MRRLQLINSLHNTNQDYDLSILNNFFENGIVKGFQVEEQSTPDLTVVVQPGKMLLEVTRYGVSENFKVLVDLNEAESVNITGTDGNVGALIIRVATDKVQDGALLDSDHSNGWTLEFIEGTSATALDDGEIEAEISGDFFYRLADIEKQATIQTANIDYKARSVLFSLMFIQDSVTGVRYNLEVNDGVFELVSQ